MRQSFQIRYLSSATDTSFPRGCPLATQPRGWKTAMAHRPWFQRNGSSGSRPAQRRSHSCLGLKYKVSRSEMLQSTVSMPGHEQRAVEPPIGKERAGLVLQGVLRRGGCQRVALEQPQPRYPTSSSIVAPVGSCWHTRRRKPRRLNEATRMADPVRQEILVYEARSHDGLLE